MFKNSIFSSSFAPHVVFDEADTGGVSTLQDDSPSTDSQTESDDKGKGGVPQETVDKLVGTARQQGREAAKKALLEEIGIESTDALANLVKAQKEAEEANKTELEKAQAKRDALEAELASAKAEASQKADALRKRVIDTEIKIAASKPVIGEDGKVIRPAFRDDALDIVLMTIGRDEIEEGEDGSLTGIEEALAELAEKKALLLKEQSDERKQVKGSPSAQRRTVRKPDATPVKRKRVTL